jgi:prepilin signal peptidase PulO-like enzyme (type II secretory pathway)
MSITLLGPAVAAAYLVMVALLVGSFINLAADRVPRAESVLRPRSHCRPCGRVLNVLDLLPVAGYLIRGGRCATCRAPIGATSPLVEAASGASMLAAILWLGIWPGAALGAVLVGLLGLGVVALSLARHRRAAEVR